MLLEEVKYLYKTKHFTKLNEGSLEQLKNSIDFFIYDILENAVLQTSTSTNSSSTQKGVVIDVTDESK